MNRRYGQNSYRQSALVKTADLRYPIAFLRAEQKPSQTDVSWHLNVKPYATEWAAYDAGVTKPSRGDEADDKALHIFIIRKNPSLNLQASDFIVHDGVLFNIEGTKPVTGRLEFTEIRCTIHSNVETAGITVDNSIQTPPKPDNSHNPFFTG